MFFYSMKYVECRKIERASTFGFECHFDYEQVIFSRSFQAITYGFWVIFACGPQFD